MTTFAFATTRVLDAPRDRVFATLRDGASWDQWWPQIRHIEPYDDRHGLVHIRSVLPVTLHVRVISEVVDEAGGILRAGLDGDLVGWAQFTLLDLDDRRDLSAALAHRMSGRSSWSRTQVEFTQECQLAKRGFRHTVGILRPVLIANHTAMMRSGLRGLERRAGMLPPA